MVFITWVDNSLNGSWEVNGIRSTDGGETFGQKFVVNDITTGGQCKGYAHFDCYGGLHFIYYHKLGTETNDLPKHLLPSPPLGLISTTLVTKAL